MFKALTAALAIAVAAGGGGLQVAETTTVGSFQLTPTANGCTLVRVLRPVDSPATMLLLIETFQDGLMVGMFDTRLLPVLENDQTYGVQLFVDDEPVIDGMRAMQKEATMRGLLGVWRERDPVLGKLATAGTIRIMQGEDLVTGAHVDGLAEAVSALRTCHADVRGG